MKFIAIFSLIAVFVILGWYMDYNTQMLDGVKNYIENSEILTLEARYTPEQIMEAHIAELLGDRSQRSFGDPNLKFYPYLLMEVKYMQQDRKTKETTILWSQVDGEMVLNTDTWETTHGFEDTISAGATHQDFKILNTLAKKRGALPKDQLAKELNVEPSLLDSWLDSARAKQLIVQKGSDIQLHFENPLFLVLPQTKMNHRLVTKPYTNAQRAPKRFSRSQIEKGAKAAFGAEFTVRNLKEVFLPVYSIPILNPDGSIHTSFWNALNGHQIPQAGF